MKTLISKSQTKQTSLKMATEEYITMPMAIRLVVPSRLEALEWSRQLKKRWYRFCDENKEHVREIQKDTVVNGQQGGIQQIRTYKALPSAMVHKFLCDNWEWGKTCIIARVEHNCEVMKQRLCGNFSYGQQPVNKKKEDHVVNMMPEDDDMTDDF